MPVAVRSNEPSYYRDLYDTTAVESGLACRSEMVNVLRYEGRNWDSLEVLLMT